MSHSEVLPPITPEESAIDSMIAEGGPLLEASYAKLKAENNYRTGDAEGFLASNASLWSGSELTWRVVKNTKYKLHAACENGFQIKPDSAGPELEPITAQSSRSVRRTLKSGGEFFALTASENVFRLTGNCMIHAEQQGFFDDPNLLAYDTADTASVLMELERLVTPTAEQTSKDAKSRSEFDVKIPTELDGLCDTLVVAHLHAQALQRIAQLRVEDFLAEDTNVAPFLEQVTGLVEMRKQGINDLPGFLEILASQIGEAHTQGTHPLQEALTRTAEQRHPRRAFVGAMLSGVDAQGGKQSKEFLGSVSGVQMAASIIGRRFAEQGVDQEAIVETIADSFDELPPEWEAAYQADLKTKSIQSWQKICDILKPYERRGRFVSKAKTKAQLLVSRSGGQSFKKRKHHPSEGLALSDLAIEPTEQEATARQLAILRNVQGGSREFSLETVDDVPELLGHTVVSKFLDVYGNEPGMTDLISSMFEHMHTDPYSPVNSKVIRSMRFSVRDPRVREQQVFRMRRFKPNTSTVSTGTRGDKVRIIYGLVPSTIGTIVALKSVEMRREAY